MSKKSSALLTRGGKKRLRTVKLHVSAVDLRSAQRLARMRTLGSLEEMLAALVADVATAYERPGSWEAGRVWDWLDSHYELPQFLRLTKEAHHA